MGLTESKGDSATSVQLIIYPLAQGVAYISSEIISWTKFNVEVANLVKNGIKG